MRARCVCSLMVLGEKVQRSGDLAFVAPEDIEVEDPGARGRSRVRPLAPQLAGDRRCSSPTMPHGAAMVRRQSLETKPVAPAARGGLAVDVLHSRSAMRPAARRSAQ